MQTHAFQIERLTHSLMWILLGVACFIAAPYVIGEGFMVFEGELGLVYCLGAAVGAPFRRSVACFVAAPFVAVAIFIFVIVIFGLAQGPGGFILLAVLGAAAYGFAMWTFR